MQAFFLWMAMTSPPHVNELFKSDAARVTLTTSLPPFIPHLQLVALAEQQLDSDIASVLKLTDDLLNKGDPFMTSWDLRQCGAPPMKTVAKCVKWAITRKKKLDTFNKRMVVLMPNKPALMSIVKLVLRAFGPTCPVKVSQDEAECVAFMREQPDDPDNTPN